MKKTTALLLGLCALSPARAEDMAARELAEPCFACHGESGVSVSDEIPNLAGQKAKYLSVQLRAFKEGTRRNPLMSAIAPQLDDSQIEQLAAFFGSLPAAASGTVSAPPGDINRTRVAFPAGYENTFRHYWTIDFPDRKQVRRYFANEVALGAAAAGQPMPDGAFLFVEVFKAKLDAAGAPVTGADGLLIADTLTFYTAMAKQPGWGDDFPEILRNGDWNYAVFKADGSLRSDVNQAQCLACHKPLGEDSFVFTLKQLQEKARL